MTVLPTAADGASAVRAHPAFRALADAVVPEDDHPSAWQVGAGKFIERILTTDRARDAEGFLTALDCLDAAAVRAYGASAASLRPGDIDSLLKAQLEQEAGRAEGAAPLQSLVDVVLQGYWGDPGNGGNDDGTSWSMIDYRPVPDGAEWPAQRSTTPPSLPWAQVKERYDVIVVGSGAGGGVAACVLAEAGLSVLLIERGRWLPASALRFDHLRSQRLSLGYETLADPPAVGHPRTVTTEQGDIAVLATDPRWGNNALTVGGGTRVYGAQAWRFCPQDFTMATTYGVPAGSSLADWPLTYADLEPDYDRAEWELGVAGDSEGDGTAGARRRGYPMPPFVHTTGSARLDSGAGHLGLSTTAVPLLINSVPYNGRGACIRCATCVGFGCPGEFKTDTRNTVIPRAIATGLCDVLTEAQVAKIRVSTDGEVTGVDVLAERDGDVVQLAVNSDEVVLSAGAVESARLLLNSRTEQYPAGLGNHHDQVGRNLQSHLYAGAWAIFDDPVQDSVGPGPGIATTDYRHGNDGLVGGAMLADDFVPTPLSVYSAAVAMGLLAPWGASSKSRMKHLFSRLILVMGPIQEVPNPDSRVTVDPGLRDRWNLPVARLSGAPHPEDLRTASFIARQAALWAEASGARTTHPVLHAPTAGPSRGQHQAGTCRMGSDPTASVTDRWGRVWGHPGLRVADASLHVTNGGVNPVLTVLALAYRVADRLVEDRRSSRLGERAQAGSDSL